MERSTNEKGAATNINTAFQALRNSLFESKASL